MREPPAALDDPGRGEAIRRRILSKPALRMLYEEVYERYASLLRRCPPGGLAVELGAGAGFARERVSGLVTADLLAYPGLDLVADAAALPFASGSLRAIVMLNVFHHLPDAAGFLGEADRCLAPGGRLLVVDQHTGWISAPILRHAHHEPFEPNARTWSFPSSGPLSGANGALAWIVFVRDRHRLGEVAPGLELVGYRPHTPLRYWLAGGLKRWSLLPGRAFRAATLVDLALTRAAPQLGSFVDVELVKAAGG